ncbi:hypothetical protein HN748_02105 [Candidatus Peregrinibacteria bacterium]|nr:hypothetical protein [Candidatus Peregrinibacteria bacterium]MBT7484265.1 hypothetical protein [Candidatus Peregrinibacteria bacterium]MBT7703002.1 hypothetical protein [Candidatus Peregrinibacteria bacterium]
MVELSNGAETRSDSLEDTGAPLSFEVSEEMEQREEVGRLQYDVRDLYQSKFFDASPEEDEVFNNVLNQVNDLEALNQILEDLDQGLVETPSDLIMTIASTMPLEQLEKYYLEDLASYVGTPHDDLILSTIGEVYEYKRTWHDGATELKEQAEQKQAEYEKKAADFLAKMNLHEVGINYIPGLIEIMKKDFSYSHIYMGDAGLAYVFEKNKGKAYLWIDNGEVTYHIPKVPRTSRASNDTAETSSETDSEKKLEFDPNHPLLMEACEVSGIPQDQLVEFLDTVVNSTDEEFAGFLDGLPDHLLEEIAYQITGEILSQFKSDIPQEQIASTFRESGIFSNEEQISRFFNKELTAEDSRHLAATMRPFAIEQLADLLN